MKTLDENISTILEIEPAPSEEETSIEVVDSENNEEDAESDDFIKLDNIEF